MKAYDASETIRATSDAIWAILTDAQGYTQWDSGVERVEGRIGLGERITLQSKASPGRAFPVRVSEFEPGRRMVWTGGMIGEPLAGVAGSSTAGAARGAGSRGCGAGRRRCTSRTWTSATASP